MEVALLFSKTIAVLRDGALLVLIGGMSYLPARAQTCTGTDPGGSPAANGLYAEYYAGYFADAQDYFTGKTPNLNQVSPQLAFTSNSSFGDLVTPGVASGTTANPDQFTARYRGSFYVGASTTYTFYLYADDAAYLWVDNDALAVPALTANALINNGGLHPARTVQASVYLTQGYHNVLVHYGESTGSNVLQLSYSSPMGTQPGPTAVPVPASAFCTALQPFKYAPTALTYTPRLLTTFQGAAATSPVPALTRNGSDMAASPSYELLNAPAGVSIDAATGTLSVAASAPTGTYTLSVRVTTETGQRFGNVFTFSVVDNPNAACTGTNPGGGPASNGLYARYYPGFFADNQAFFATTESPVVRIDPQLNYATSDGWGLLTPPATGTDANPNAFSARYQGALLIATAGTYTFYLTADDAAFLWLDNAARRSTPLTAEAVVKNGGVHPVGTAAGTTYLTAGKHDVVVHYGEQSGANILVLEYESAAAGLVRTVVPASALCSSTTGQPLPVELTRFGAAPTATGVALSWATASEKNSAYFDLERSADGRAYAAVGRVAGAGTTATPQHYEWLDRAPLTGVSYYRLHQVDRDGTDAYSPVAAVTVTGRGSSLSAQVLPNPAVAGEAFQVRVQQATALPAQLTVLDLQGRVLHTQALPASVATEVSVQLPGLVTGMYLVRLTSSAGTLTERLLVR